MPPLKEKEAKNDDETIVIQPVFKAYGEFIIVGALLLLFGGWGIFVFLYILYDMKARKYLITDEKIVYERGLIWKSAREISMSRIKDVYVSYIPGQKYLDVGTVRVLQRDGTGGKPLEIRGVPHPEELGKLLRKQAAAAAAGVAKARTVAKKPA